MDKSSSKLNKRLIIAIVTLLLAVPALYIGIGCIDEKRREFPQLEFTPPPPKNIPNGLPDIKTAESLIDDSDQWIQLLSATSDSDVFHADHQYDDAYWKDILTKNKAALKKLREGLSKQYYYEKVVITPSLMYTIHNPRPALAPLYADILSSVENRQWSKVEQDLYMLRQFVRHYLRDNSSLLNIYYVQEIAHRVRQLLHYAIVSPSIPDASLLQLLTQCQDSLLPDFKKAFTASLKSEFATIQACIDSPNTEDFLDEGLVCPYNAFTFHELAYLNMAGDSLSTMLAYETLAPPAIQVEIDKLVAPDRANASLEFPSVLKPNALGRYYSSRYWHYANYAIRFYTQSIYDDLLSLKIASILHQRKHGKAATSITELHAIIGKELTDPMASPTSHYQFSTATKRVWSIGEDMINNGGAVKDDIFLYPDSLHEDILLSLE